MSVHEYGNAWNYIKIDVDVCVSMCFCKASKPTMTKKFWTSLEFPSVEKDEHTYMHTYTLI